LRGNAELIHSLTERGISGNDNTNINPYTIMSATPTFFEMKRDASGIFPFNSYPGNGANFLQNADLVHTPEDVFRQIGGAQANVSLIASERQTLDFRLQGGIDHYDDNARVYSPPELYYEQTNTVSPYPGTVVNTKGVVTTATLNASLAHRLIASAFTATTSAGVRQGRSQSDVINSLGNGLLTGSNQLCQRAATELGGGSVAGKRLFVLRARGIFDALRPAVPDDRRQRRAFEQ